MEINKLIKSLETLDKKDIKSFKIPLSKENINVKKLLDEIKLCLNSKG